MEFKKLFLAGLAIVNLVQLQAADIALTACDNSGSEKIIPGRPCPLHDGKTVKHCEDSDGVIKHTHYEDTGVYTLHNDNYTIAYAAARRALRGR